MFERSSVADSQEAETAGTARKCPESLPLRLSFVISAYNTAQRLIRFSDEKASFMFLFLGITLSIFGIRGDRILLIFIMLFLVFLATMVFSLFYASRSSPRASRRRWRTRDTAACTGVTTSYVIR